MNMRSISTSAVLGAWIVAAATLPAREAEAGMIQKASLGTTRDTVPVFFEHQVTESVQVLGWKAPTYPPKLKADGVEGEVLLEFIVDTNGKMEPKSLKVVRATNAEFAAAVQRTVSSATFAPATLNNKRVRQVVHQEFRFDRPR